MFLLCGWTESRGQTLAPDPERSGYLACGAKWGPWLPRHLGLCCWSVTRAGRTQPRSLACLQSFLSSKAQYVVVSSAPLTGSWGGVQSSSNHFSHCLYEDMYDIMYGAKIHEKSNSKEESTMTHSLGVQPTMVGRAWQQECERLVTPHPQPGGRER